MGLVGGILHYLILGPYPNREVTHASCLPSGGGHRLGLGVYGAQRFFASDLSGGDYLTLALTEEEGGSGRVVTPYNVYFKNVKRRVSPLPIADRLVEANTHLTHPQPPACSFWGSGPFFLASFGIRREVGLSVWDRGLF